MANIDMNKVLEGVELVDAETENLAASAKQLVATKAFLTGRLAACDVELVEVSAKLEERKGMPSLRERAEKMIGQMAEMALPEAAIRAAIVQTFGKSKPAAAPKALKPPSAAKETLITVGLPSADTQLSILAAVRAGGIEGVRMETLYNSFAVNGAERDEKLEKGVFATVKNAVIKGTVRQGAELARGKRYYWQGDVEVPAQETAPASETPVAETETSAQ